MIFPKKMLRTACLTVALTALCTVAASAACVGVGNVNAGGLRLREEVGTGAVILDLAAEGDNVVVLEDVGEGWYRVDYKSVEGYMSGEFLDIQAVADVDIGKGLVQTEGPTLNVRSGPSMDSDVVVVLYDKTIVDIKGVNNGWYQICTNNGTEGYVSSEYMVTCKDSGGARGDGTVAAVPTGVGQQAANYAMQFLGRPYVYGGNGPNVFDCSGFTTYVYRQFGYTLNRTATGQLSNGVSVSKSELRPGDLVFFRYNTSKPVSHVGIYIGGGQFIHASTNEYVVRIDNLTYGHYANVYVYGRRIL